MAYDSATFTVDPLALTTPRARLEYLRDFLRALPPKRFDMNRPHVEMTECGSAGCIGGWARELFGLEGGLYLVGDELGLTGKQSGELFFDVTGWRYSDITPAMAADVLDHIIRTGEVDWSVATAAPLNGPSSPGMPK